MISGSFKSIILLLAVCFLYTILVFIFTFVIPLGAFGLILVTPILSFIFIPLLSVTSFQLIYAVNFVFFLFHILLITILYKSLSKMLGLSTLRIFIYIPIIALYSFLLFGINSLITQLAMGIK